MRGIIYKDLYDNFRIWKNLASYIFALIFVGGWAFLFSESEYYFVLLIMVIVLCGACAVESSAEQDEAANFNRLLISFPVTKEEIVIAKYILALIFIAGANILSLIVTVIHVMIVGTLNFSEALPVWAVGVCVSFFITGIIYIEYFIFGKRIGTIVFVVLIAVAAGAYGSLSVIFGIEKFVQMDKTLLLCAGFPVSVLVFAVSCLISIFVYKKKYS